MENQDEMVTVYSSGGFSAEMEAETIKGILDSNGVPALLTGMDVLAGAHEIQIQVPSDRRAEAERLIAEAQAAGPAAAEAGEAEFEKQ